MLMFKICPSVICFFKYLGYDQSWKSNVLRKTLQCKYKQHTHPRFVRLIRHIWLILFVCALAAYIYCEHYVKSHTHMHLVLVSI